MSQVEQWRETILALGITQATSLATIFEKLIGGIHGKQKVETLEAIARLAKERAESAEREAEQLRGKLKSLEALRVYEEFSYHKGAYWRKSPDGRHHREPHCPSCRFPVFFSDSGQYWCDKCKAHLSLMDADVIEIVSKKEIDFFD